jgi:hypothetical protein
VTYKVVPDDMSNLFPGVVPNFTDVTWLKFAPLTFTRAPPAVFPDVGETAVILGAGT